MRQFVGDAEQQHLGIGHRESFLDTVRGICPDVGAALDRQAPGQLVAQLDRTIP